MSDAATLGARGRVRGPVLEYAARRPALICLAALVAVSGAVLIAMGSDLILYGDEWNLVLDRRGLSAAAFLDPHQGHLVLGLVVIYKALLAIFGMSSPLPFHVTSTLVYLLAAVLLFAYARRRVGDWLALLGTAVVLFFGASAVDMLSPFQIFFSGSIAAGIGALLALDRDDAPGDLAACLLLASSIAFSEVGIAFSVGVAVRMALGPKPLVPRLYVVLVPLSLYALWWVGWGNNDPSYLSAANAATTPRYVLDAASTALGALVGLTSSIDQLPDQVGANWAPIVLAVAVGLAAWRVSRLGRVPHGVWPVLAIGLTFWILAGLNANVFRPAGNGRYVYPSAIFILLIASELLRGVRPRPIAMLAVTALAAVSLGANLVFLSDSYRLFWRKSSQVAHADLRALEIAGPLHPSYVLTADFLDIPASSYLSAVRAWGSPAYTEAELAASPDGQRLAADQVLGSILGFHLQPGGSVTGSCRVVAASASGGTGVALGPGRFTLRAASGASVEVRLGRFSDQLPIALGPLAAGSSSSLTIPVDRSSLPWRLGLQGRGQVEVCGVG